jgi:beta-glucosidase
LATPVAAGVFALLTQSSKAEAASSIHFPRRFFWGVSTSAFQIEGALKADGRGPSIWDDVAESSASGVAAIDHYHRWREDVGLLESLGVNAYRLSVAWPRVLPSGAGKANSRGLDFYDRLVDRLLAANITPFVCLYHWDLPAALQARGGWLDRDIVDRFVQFAMIISHRLGDRVHHWIPINEALSIAYGGYMTGDFPPFTRNRSAYFTAAHHLNLAQGTAFKALASRGRKLGTAMCLYPVRPLSPNNEDAAAAESYAGMTTKLFLDPLLRGTYPKAVERYLAEIVRPEDLATIRHSVDFVGINYYGPEYRQAEPGNPFGTEAPHQLRLMTNGTPIDASGLYEQLKDLRDSYGNPPVIITENGAAFRDRLDGRLVHDAERVAYLRDHLGSAHKALSEGVDLRGYFVWSIMHNYEWMSGFNCRFGLVYVDAETGKRVPKSSFYWYRQVVGSGAVDLLRGRLEKR